MKKRIFAIIALLTLVLGGASAQSAVGVGEQVTSESAIQEGVSYILQQQATGSPYIADAGTYYSVPNSGSTATENCVYQFISNGDGTWNIKNVYTGKYWGIPVNGQDLQPADEASAGVWSLNFNNGVAYPTQAARRAVSTVLVRDCGDTRQVRVQRSR